MCATVYFLSFRWSHFSCTYTIFNHISNGIICRWWWYVSLLHLNTHGPNTFGIHHLDSNQRANAKAKRSNRTNWRRKKKTNEISKEKYRVDCLSIVSFCFVFLFAFICIYAISSKCALWHVISIEEIIQQKHCERQTGEEEWTSERTHPDYIDERRKCRWYTNKLFTKHLKLFVFSSFSF